MTVKKYTFNPIKIIEFQQVPSIGIQIGEDK